MSVNSGEINNTRVGVLLISWVVHFDFCQTYQSADRWLTMHGSGSFGENKKFYGYSKHVYNYYTAVDDSFYY